MDRVPWLCALLTAAGLLILSSGPCEVKGASVSPGRHASDVETRVTLAADRRRSEHREEQLARWENWVEEEKTESYERHREAREQWREWHYDGVYPSYQYNQDVPY